MNQQDRTAQWLRYPEARRRFGIGKSFLARKAREGLLHPSRPSRRMTLWSAAELERLLEAAQNKDAAVSETATS